MKTECYLKSINERDIYIKKLYQPETLQETLSQLFLAELLRKSSHNVHCYLCVYMGDVYFHQAICLVIYPNLKRILKPLYI